MMIGRIFTDAVRSAIDGQARVFDYGDQNTFVHLWTMGKGGCPRAFGTGDGSTARKPIIIVWDGRVLRTPKDRADSVSDERTANVSDEGAGRAFEQRAASLEPHLTPMDWALAYSIRALAQKGEVPKCADVAIHIVDLTGRDHTAWSMRMRHQLLAEMPWVTLHAPLIPKGPYRGGYRPVLDGCGSLLEKDGKVWTLRSEADTLKTCVSRRYGKNLEGLSRQWASTLVQTHDHHDLNNIAGPWILSGEMPDESTPLHFAFWSRLAWTGFMHEASSKREAENIATGPMGKLDVLAIDDQLGTGWDDVIRRLFGAEKKKKKNSEENTQCSVEQIGSSGEIQLYGSSYARTLLPNLKKEGAFKKRCFDSPIPCSDDKRPWLLVLDLLLFSGGSSAEREWLTDLLCIARGIPEDSSSLAWPGFSEDGELDVVEKWLDSGNVEAPAYNTALSLLPRLCALRWPSVPILLLSGTSRRALTDKLAAYRNIFLAPRKPNSLSGNVDEEIVTFFGEWRRELQATKGLIEVQRKLLRLQDCLSNSSVPEIVVQDEKPYEIALYIDETGNEFNRSHSVTVGGLLLAGQPAQIHSLCEKLKTTIDDFRCPHGAGSNLKDITRRHVDQLAKIIYDWRNVHASVVSLTGSRTRSIQVEIGDVEDELSADNLYREIVGALIEVAVYHFAAQRLEQVSELKYRVFLASRVLPVLPNAATNLWNYWGIRKVRDSSGNFISLRSGKWLVHLLDFSDARPIVQGISRQYRAATFSPLPQWARAYMLDQTTFPTFGSEHYAAHLVADALISNNKPSSHVKKLVDQGFAGNWEEDLRKLIGAARYSVNGDLGRGICETLELPDVSYICPNDVNKRLLARLGRLIPRMNGTDIMRCKIAVELVDQSQVRSPTES